MDEHPALAALGEKYSVEILHAAAEPHSAREFSELLDVPIATCYRRIEALEVAGLLTEAGTELSDRGRRTTVYRRTVDELAVSFEGDAVAVTTGTFTTGEDDD
jgi:predicted ArsR family transcriptional regulator